MLSASCTAWTTAMIANTNEATNETQPSANENPNEALGCGW